MVSPFIRILESRTLLLHQNRLIPRTHIHNHKSIRIMRHIQRLQLINRNHLIMLIIPHLQHHHTIQAMQDIILILHRSLLPSLLIYLEIEQIQLTNPISIHRHILSKPRIVTFIKISNTLLCLREQVRFINLHEMISLEKEICHGILGIDETINLENNNRYICKKK